MAANPESPENLRLRPAEVEAEILQATGVQCDDWLRLAPSLRPETVVHLARLLLLSGRTSASGLLLKKIVFRAANPIIFGNARGFSDHELEDIVSEVYLRILDAVKNGASSRPSFLEIKFGLKVKQLTLDAVRKAAREKRHEARATLDDWQQEEADYAAHLEVEHDERDREFQVRVNEVTARCLARFPYWVQEAFARHYVDGIVIESDTPTVMSIARLYGCTGRTVRNWFAKVRQTIRTEIRSSDHD